MESGSRISYTRTLQQQTLVYLSVSPPNVSVMLVWNNLADPNLSAVSDFACFSQTLPLNLEMILLISMKESSISRTLNSLFNSEFE